MPIYSFKCPNNHLHEEILSLFEQEIIVQKYGKVLIQCPECKEMAEKIMSITANMNKQWAEQTWGKSK